jgi:hypothetical protein
MIRRFLLGTFAAAACAVSITACGTRPADLDLSLSHASAQGRFVVALEPPASGPALNQLHGWQVRVARPDGVPVPLARITVDGGMPQHGHGLPTKPRVTRELSPGVYALEGMKFSMTGWWDLRLAIEAGGVSDKAVFNVIVDEHGVQRMSVASAAPAAAPLTAPAGTQAAAQPRTQELHL